MIGTLNSNASEIPKSIKHGGSSEFESNVYWMKENSKLKLTSYTVKPKGKILKNVLILSTFEMFNAVTKDDGKHKLAVIKHDDFTKGGTDIVDQRQEYYSAKNKTRDWTKTIWGFSIDTAILNSQTVCALNNNKIPRKPNSYEFGMDLVGQLPKYFTKSRSIQGLSSTIQRKIRRGVDCSSAISIDTKCKDFRRKKPLLQMPRIN